MNAVDSDYAIQKSWHHKSGEKSKHFSYPNFFAYPNTWIAGVGQRGSDNRGWTVHLYKDKYIYPPDINTDTHILCVCRSFFPVWFS